MSDYDSNYSGLCCPCCEENISNKIPPSGSWVFDLEDEDSDFFQCQKCDKFFKAELNIFKEYNYDINKPTKKEVKEYNLIVNKVRDVIEDCPGQIFMWENLFLNES